MIIKSIFLFVKHMEQLLLNNSLSATYHCIQKLRIVTGDARGRLRCQKMTVNRMGNYPKSLLYPKIEGNHLLGCVIGDK